MSGRYGGPGSSSSALTDPTPFPSHRSLVDDLRVLRERGLVQLRRLELPALRHAARLLFAERPDSPASVEALVRTAVEQMEPGSLADAAAYTLGITAGTRDWSAQDRRRRAAEIYGITPEHFRKGRERMVLEQVAEQIIALGGTFRPPMPGRPMAGRPVLSPAEILPTRRGLPPITLHVSPIELVTDVDVLVSSENVYFEMSKTFGASVSAALRRAGAERSPTGEIIDDVVGRGLAGWLAAHGRTGLPVAPGTVADTAPGSLAANGVKRIHHAAIASPRPGSHMYETDPDVISQAVHNVFRLAERQRESFAPPLKSLCFPLFGAGRGGLDPATSITHLWRALVLELAAAPYWLLHIATSNTQHAEVVLNIVRGANQAEFGR